MMSSSIAQQDEIILYYFPCQGRAQPLRLMLIDAGKQFTEKNIKMEEWSQAQQDESKSGPYGLLPILTWNGTQIAETLSIAQFLSKKLGYTLQSDDENDEKKIILQDSLFYSIYQDLFSNFMNSLWAQIFYEGCSINNVIKDVKERIKHFLERYQKIMGQNPYCVGSSPTAADFFLFVSLRALILGFGPSLKLEEEFPILYAFYQRMMQRPNLHEYYKKQTESPEPYFTLLSGSPLESEVLAVMKQTF